MAVIIDKSQHQLNKLLSIDKKVAHAVKNHADKAGRRAESILAGHRHTGAAKIDVTQIKNVKYGHIDWLVSLVDEAAMSIEFGHMSRSGRYVPGIYAITKGALGI